MKTLKTELTTLLGAFALLVSSVISLGYYMFNREKDRQNRNPNPNMKYVLTFGIVFIVSLLGKILYGGTQKSERLYHQKYWT